MGQPQQSNEGYRQRGAGESRADTNHSVVLEQSVWQRGGVKSGGKGRSQGQGAS